MASDAEPLRSGAAWLLTTASLCAAVLACRTVQGPAALAAAPRPSTVAEAGPPPVAAPALRVGILVEGPRAEVGSAKGIEVWLRPESDGRLRRLCLARATFAPSGDGRIRLVETGDRAALAVVAPSIPSEPLATGGELYRGLVELRPAAGGTLTVVNIVHLEDYVRGVVPNELSPGASVPIEALKAQAVAARTYALSHRGEYSSKGFDLCATQACQVYRGASSEHPASDRAVADTRGVLATWRGRPIHAYYTSACGGHTESGRAVFDDKAPYLRGVACVAEDHVGPRERAAHDVAWQVRLTPAEVRLAMARYGQVGYVHDLVPRRTGVSGRIVELAVVGAEGEVLLRGVNVRWGLRVPETLFVIGRETAPDGAVERFVLMGLGRGHGVGLCQLGAAAMARSGAGYGTILKHYYSGIALTAAAS